MNFLKRKGELSNMSKVINIDVYDLRKKGIEACKTEGSQHYKKKTNNEIEPLEFAILNNRFEDFAITNIIKYVERFRNTRNIDDLKKAVDYSHILAGVEVSKKK